MLWLTSFIGLLLYHHTKGEKAMDKFDTTINRHRAALTKKAALVLQGRTQAEVADKLGFNRQTLNAYLNRKIDLLPKDIKALLEELEIENLLPKLSSPANI